MHSRPMLKGESGDLSNEMCLLNNRLSSSLPADVFIYALFFLIE